MKAAIIGAGIAGLATAIRLQNLGYKVSVFESNHYLGGKIAQIHRDGFRFDTGASLFAFPELIDELFTLSGKERKDYLTYQKLETSNKYFFDDGTIVNAYSDKNALAKELEEKLGEFSQKTLDFFERNAKLYELTLGLFLEKSLHKKTTFFNKKILKTFWNIRKLGIFQTMHQSNSKTFRNPKTVQIFDRFATYYGANPYKASSTLNLIPHLEHQSPSYFPEGGMYSIIKSLVALAKDLGVEFFTGHKIDEIIVWEKKVRGLSSNKEILEFDLVVSNLDISNTYRKLLPLHKTPKSLQKQNLSPSAIVFYWGMNKEFEELDLHNVFFGKDYKQEFENIFEKQSICNEPSIYLYISSKKEPKDAPQGCQNWYIMVNAPHNAGQNWGKLIKKTRKNVIKKLSKVFKTNIENHIISEDCLTPLKIEARTASIAGSLYGTSSNSRLSPFFRPANFTKQIKNLYFCGASVHPGGGIPLCLISAKIVADLVKK